MLVLEQVHKLQGGLEGLLTGAPSGIGGARVWNTETATAMKACGAGHGMIDAACAEDRDGYLQENPGVVIDTIPVADFCLQGERYFGFQVDVFRRSPHKGLRLDFGDLRKGYARNDLIAPFVR